MHVCPVEESARFIRMLKQRNCIFLDNYSRVSQPLLAAGGMSGTQAPVCDQLNVEPRWAKLEALKS